jgi:hypothetical protein
MSLSILRISSIASFQFGGCVVMAVGYALFRFVVPREKRGIQYAAASRIHH